MLCHPIPTDCDRCLRKLAGALAEEMAWDVDRARAQTVTAYQDELGAEICSFERANDLRWFTVQACLLAERDKPFLVAAPDAASAAAKPVFRLTQSKVAKLWIALYVAWVVAFLVLCFRGCQ